MAKFTSLEFLSNSYELKVNWSEGSPSYYELKNGLKLEVVEDDITVTTGIISNESLFMVRAEKYFTARNSGGSNGDVKFGDISYDPSDESNIYVGDTQMLFAPSGLHVAIIGTDDMRYGRRSNCFYPLNETVAYIELKLIGSGADYNVIFGFLAAE
jgi:hypothetical protein